MAAWLFMALIHANFGVKGRLNKSSMSMEIIISYQY